MKESFKFLAFLSLMAIIIGSLWYHNIDVIITAILVFVLTAVLLVE